jgi:membrane protease YdiL (CAAX protease family)
MAGEEKGGRTMMSALARHRRIVWVTWLIAALLFLEIGNLLVYGLVVPLSAGALVLLAPGLLPHTDRQADKQDLRTVLAMYVGVVTSLYLAFQVFTTGHVVGLFLCFAAALIMGVVGPVIYTVRVRRRPLADLGLRLTNSRDAVGLGLALAAAQFFLTLYGHALPARAVDWVPLAVMALMVGLFEAIFFRGFIQTRLSASMGPGAGTVSAAAMYSLYHVGYGMGPRDMIFLFGLGIVYAVAYACVRNILVLWPLLIPMGSFFNNLQSGGFALPWASILGFVDVLGVMFAAVWLAHRRERPTPARSEAPEAVTTGTTPVR